MIFGAEAEEEIIRLGTILSQNISEHIVFILRNNGAGIINIGANVAATVIAGIVAG